MHDPLFRSITLTPRNLAITKDLTAPNSLGPNPVVLQSMIICKQPEIGAAVQPHQDSTFLYTDPPSAVGFWYALEDATVSNGCLSFVPGSHLWEPVRKRLVRMQEADGGDGTGFIDLPADGANGLPEGAKARENKGKVEDEKFVNGEVRAGTLVLIHGNVLHKSSKNLSGKSRHIYTFHGECSICVVKTRWIDIYGLFCTIAISGDYGYDKLNWLQPGVEGFSRLERMTTTA